MELRNIHFQAEDSVPDRESPDSPSSYPEPAPPASVSETRLRTRKVKVSPHQEYAMRPGEVRPIGDALAALICCRKGRAEIGPKGISVERKDIGGKRIYHHVDSVLCNDLSQRERKIFYVLNSLKPDIIHLLDDTGRYIESLPEKFQPGVLNVEEQQKELRDQKRQVSRLARHLQDLHGKDTEEAIATLARNADTMKGIVQVLGTTNAQPVREAAPSPIGERVAAGERRITTERATRQSAIALGRAVTMERASMSDPSDPSDLSEDWSSSPRIQHQQPQTTPVETW